MAESKQAVSPETVARTTLERIKTIDESSAEPTIQTKLPSPSSQRKLDTLSERPFDLEKYTDGVFRERGGGPNPPTIFYLAYGSNLCARTFQGQRGIRPLSQANVVVPELVLTFDLAGIPYIEPCFANTRYRDPQRSPETVKSHDDNDNDEKSALLPAVITTNSTPPPRNSRRYRKTEWHKGLVGVVYEVTTKDFAHIIATEGGGAAYQDILVDCYDLPLGDALVPAHPTSQPFKAHTLFSPSIAPGGKTPDSIGKRYSRPDHNYAQPSQRYLTLLTDGADEHALPQEYKSYLHRLRPYRRTTTRQETGKKLISLLWLPIFNVQRRLARFFGDERGRSPPWLQKALGVSFWSIWACYDGVLKRTFGDGERTIGNDDDDEEEEEEEEGDDGKGSK